MNQAITSLFRPATMMSLSVPQINLPCLKLWKPLKPLRGSAFRHIPPNHPIICCTKVSSWEPSPFTYAPSDDSGSTLLDKNSNIFESMNTNTITKAPLPFNGDDDVTEPRDEQSIEPQLLKWPMWLLGPSILLVTGMTPTLWLPLSSVFLGTNTASLLSLVGLDCIFNLGATLFLLMADSCARAKIPNQTCTSEAPLSYRFWNIFASIIGLIIPLMMFFTSHKGFLEPQMGFISAAILLGPYILLLSIQMLTEMLTWHWKSPVWLVTPIVYEAYRVLQLMRGLKLGGEIGAPMWVMGTIRGLVSWWILILGMQLMRVAWFAGFTSRAQGKA